MRNRTKNREAFKSQHSYWQSYSDMMAALLLIFILMIAIALYFLFTLAWQVWLQRRKER